MTKILPSTPLPLRYSVLCCGQFSSLRVMYCSSAQLQKKKRERTRTYSRSRQFGAFVCFVLPSHRWLEGFRLVWMVGNGFKSAKTFRQVAMRKATSKSRENGLTDFCWRFIVLSLFLKKSFEAVCKWLSTGFHRNFLRSRSLMSFKYSQKNKSL